MNCRLFTLGATQKQRWAMIVFSVDTFTRSSKSQFPLVLLALTLKNETGGVPGKSHALNVLLLTQSNTTHNTVFTIFLVRGSKMQGLIQDVVRIHGSGSSSVLGVELWHRDQRGCGVSALGIFQSPCTWAPCAGWPGWGRGGIREGLTRFVMQTAKNNDLNIL